MSVCDLKAMAAAALDPHYTGGNDDGSITTDMIMNRQFRPTQSQVAMTYQLADNEKINFDLVPAPIVESAAAVPVAPPVSEPNYVEGFADSPDEDADDGFFEAHSANDASGDDAEIIDRPDDEPPEDAGSAVQPIHLQEADAENMSYVSDISQEEETAAVFETEQQRKQRLQVQKEIERERLESLREIIDELAMNVGIDPRKTILYSSTDTVQMREATRVRLERKYAQHQWTSNVIDFGTFVFAAVEKAAERFPQFFGDMSGLKNTMLGDRKQLERPLREIRAKIPPRRGGGVPQPEKELSMMMGKRFFQFMQNRGNGVQKVIEGMSVAEHPFQKETPAEMMMQVTAANKDLSHLAPDLDSDSDSDDDFGGINESVAPPPTQPAPPLVSTAEIKELAAQKEELQRQQNQIKEEIKRLQLEKEAADAAVTKQRNAVAALRTEANFVKEEVEALSKRRMHEETVATVNHIGGDDVTVRMEEIREDNEDGSSNEGSTDTQSDALGDVVDRRPPPSTVFDVNVRH